MSSFIFDDVIPPTNKGTSSPPVSKSWVSSIRDKFIPSWLKPEIALSAADRNLAQRLVAAVEKLPSEARHQLDEFKERSLSEALGLRVPDGFGEFVCMLTDVVTITLIDDATIMTLMQPRLIIQYGVAYTAVIDGLALFVKQFLKRMRAPENQGDGDDTDGSMHASVYGLLSALYAYTIGSVPTSIPSDVVKTLVGYNAAFSVARNLEHFGLYVIKMVKYAIDAIWRLVTKKPWFDQSQQLAIDEVKSVLATGALYCDGHELKASEVSKLNALIARGETALARATSLGIDKPTCDQLASALSRLSAVAANSAPAAYMAEDNPPLVLTSLVGASGIGKTFLVKAITAALSSLEGWSGSLSDWLVIRQKDVNFQSALPADPKVLWIDDTWLISDNEDYASTLRYIGDLGSGVPKLKDEAVAEKKGRFFEIYSYGFTTDNKLPNQLPATTNAPVARRFTGGIHAVQLSPEFAQKARLDMARLLSGDDKESLLRAADAAWTFVDHVGVQRNFAEFVTSLYKVRLDYIKRSKRVSHFYTAVADGFSISDSQNSRPSAAPTVWGTWNTLKGFEGFIEDVAASGVKNRKRSNSKGKAHEARAVDPIVSIAPTASSSVEEQSFTTSLTDAEVVEALGDSKCSADANRYDVGRMIKYMEAASVKFDLTRAGLTVDGKPHSVEDLRRRLQTRPKRQAVDFDVPINDWTDRHFHALSEQTFFVKNNCLRHGAVCYEHPGEICEAFDDDAIVVGQGGLATWALANGYYGHWTGYLTVVAATVPAHTASTWYTKLRWFATIISSAAIGYGVALILTKLVNSYYHKTEDQAYSHSYAQRTGKATKALVRPSIVPKAKNQAGGDVANFGWLADKLHNAVMPCKTWTMTTTQSCQLKIGAGNIATLPAHMFPEGTYQIDIGGHIAQRLPVVYLKSIADLAKMPAVQVLRLPKFDDVVVFLPLSITSSKANVKYHIEDDVNLASLTGCVMFVRKELEVAYGADGKPVPQVLDPLVAFPLGDVEDVRSYSTTGTYTGIFIKAPVRTSKLMCGFPVFTTNTLVGRGHHIILGEHRAYSDESRCSVVVPHTVSFFDEIIHGAPHGTITLVETQSWPRELLRPTTGHIADNIQLVGELIPSETQHQNSKNSIIASPLHDALTGMVVRDPITGEMVKIPPPDVAPSPVWDPTTALKKIKLTNFVPSREDYDLYVQCVQATAERIEKFADPRLLKPQTELFTIAEAIHGVPDLGIPGLDMKKSPGYIPGHKTSGLGRTYWATEVAPGQWELKPHGERVVRKYTNMILKGKIPRAFVVTHTKEELRSLVHTCPICDKETGDFKQHCDHVKNHIDLRVDDESLYLGEDLDGNLVDQVRVKYARITNAYAFPLTVAMRRFGMHVPACLISGRIHNGMSFGADLSGRDGDVWMSAIEAQEYTVDADASNFDASKCSYFAEPAEKACARLVRHRFPFVSEDAAWVIGKLSRVCFMVSGKLVWFQYFMLNSGHVWTTPLNCIDSQSIARFAFARCGATGKFDERVVSLAYGDDLRNDHSVPEYKLQSIIDAGAAFNIPYTAGSKLVGDTGSTDRATAVHLKRRVYRTSGGFVQAPLTLKAIAHIHAFIRSKEFNREEATILNADAALREWFHYGRETFEAVKDRLNAELRRLGFKQVTLNYDEIRVGWFNNHGGALSRYIMQRDAEDQSSLKQAILNPVLTTEVVENQSEAKSDTPTSKPSAVAPKNVASALLVSPDQDSESKLIANPNATTVTTPDSGVVTQQKLTKHVDAAGMYESRLPARVLRSQITPLNPFPKQGVEKFLEREFPVKTISWPAADGFGAAEGQIILPDDLFALPSISAKMAKFRYSRCSVELSIRVNGGEYVGGCLNVAFFPGLDPASSESWRFQSPLCFNAQSWHLSAGSPNALKIPLPWSSPLTWYDIQSSRPIAAVGTIRFNVLAPQQWMSGTPPTALTVSVNARLKDVQLAGNDTNAGPAVAMMHNRYTVAEAVRNAKFDSSPVENQSNAQEAIQKTTSGVVTAVQNTVKTVDAIIKVADTIGETLALFDKPNTVAAVQPIRVVNGEDMVHADGMFDGPMLAQPINAYVSADNGQMSEADPKPSWLSLAKLPGLVDYFTMLGGAIHGDKLFASRLHPTMSLKGGTGAAVQVWAPTPLAWVTGFHRLYFGDLKILIRAFSPSAQKAQIRVTLLPNMTLSAGISDSDSGDVESGVYDIVGDTDIKLTMRYLSPYMMLLSGPPDVTPSPYTEWGQIVVQVVQPISTQIAPSPASIFFAVYIAAGENFKWAVPQNLWPNYTYSTSATPALADAIRHPRRTMEEVEDQACVRDIFGEPFTTLSPSSPIVHQGIVGQDECRGPCEALRRHMSPLEFTLPVTWAPGFPGIGADAQSDRVAPFRYWSGSQVYRITAYDGNCLVLVEQNYDFGDDAKFEGGAMFVHLSDTKSFSFNTPWSNNLPACTINGDTLDTSVPASFSIRQQGTVGTAPTTLVATYAQGDDFCLYHFVAPPFLHQAISMPEPKWSREAPTLRANATQRGQIRAAPLPPARDDRRSDDLWEKRRAAPLKSGKSNV